MIPGSKASLNRPPAASLRGRKNAYGAGKTTAVHILATGPAPSRDMSQTQISIPLTMTTPSSAHVLQLPFHVECLVAACSVTGRHAPDVTVCNGNGRLLRGAQRGAAVARSWIL